MTRSSDRPLPPIEVEVRQGEAAHSEVESAPDRDHAVLLPGDHLPTVVVALPLNQRPVFPTMTLPLVIPAGRLADAVRAALKDHGGHIGFFLTRTALDDSAAFAYGDLLPIGSVARVVKHHEIEGGGLQVFAQVLARFQIAALERAEPVLLVRGAVVRPQVDAADPQVRACAMAIVAALKELVQHNPVFADEIRMVLANFNNIDGPGRLADVAASLTTAKREDIQQVLETYEVVPRMEKVLLLLAREQQLAQMKAKITHQIEEKVSDHQRRFFLNEQLKSIKQELGLESDDKSLDLQRFRDVLAQKGAAMSAEVRGVMEEELRKLGLLDPAANEYGVVRTRLEWLSDLPWGVVTPDQLDLRGAARRARRRPLRSGGDQAAHHRVLRGAPAEGRARRGHHRPGRAARHRQDLGRRVDRAPARAEVLPPVAGRHARRGRDQGPPPHLRRRAARASWPRRCAAPAR